MSAPNVDHPRRIVFDPHALPEYSEQAFRTPTACGPSPPADTAYQNAKKNSDKQNARIEHDKALHRVMTAVLKDDTELFKQFMDNESFRRWMTDTVFGLTYEPSGARGLSSE